MTAEEQRLLDAFKTVQASGNRLGILKKHLWPIADSLVDKNHLSSKGPQGLYYLKESKRSE